MQHAARYHIVTFSNQNPIYARKMSEKLEEILQRFKDDWDALERELRRFIDELKRGDQNDFPGLDPNVQVPFVRLVLEECSKGRELNETQPAAALSATLEMVERIRQEVRKVGFWKNQSMRELLTRTLVRTSIKPVLSTGRRAGFGATPRRAGKRESRKPDAVTMETLELSNLVFEVRRSPRRTTLGLTVDRGASGDSRAGVERPGGVSALDAIETLVGAQ